MWRQIYSNVGTWTGTLMVDGDVETTDWQATPLWPKIDDWIVTTDYITSTEVAWPSRGDYDFECTFEDPDARPAADGIVISIYARINDIQA